MVTVDWRRSCGAAAAFMLAATQDVAAEAPQDSASHHAESFAALDRIFSDFTLDAHVPGLVYGIVADGRLVHVRGLGQQDLESNLPVTADTLFRIASMTKAFTALTILKLRDAGKLRLDALAEDYVPELRGWRYPSSDSPRIRLRDLLNHTAGFVTDDPWGDRQTPLPEADFSRLLRDGVPFARSPGMAMEYSNLGYALLGRVVSNLSERPYAETIGAGLLRPLGMQSTGFDVAAAPRERRALGYRWEDGGWQMEPEMAHGAFGAMGGIQTSANDYARWVAFLLSAWPPRDDANAGPVRRATVRELMQGSNFPRLRQRPGRSGATACRQAANYAMGLWVAIDCDLGLTLSHSGGYPGYGSYMLLLPDHGIGVFAFANRTYAGPSGAIWDAALALQKAGLIKNRSTAVGAALPNAYRAVGAIYSRGEVMSSADMLAMNFLLDRDAAGWQRDLAALKQQVGDCDTAAPLAANHELAGEFVWRCGRGRISGSLLLAPTLPPRIQQIRLERTSP
jgi:D-alanyl-D-alanine-carboxypeptidase/D-alanyl-D-alanine-endopeptidase